MTLLFLATDPETGKAAFPFMPPGKPGPVILKTFVKVAAMVLADVALFVTKMLGQDTTTEYSISILCSIP